MASWFGFWWGLSSWPHSLCIFIWQGERERVNSLMSLLVMTLTLSHLGPTFMASFNQSYLLIGLSLQCRRSQFNFWIRKIHWRRERLSTPVFLGFPQLIKNLPAMWETWVWSLGWEDPLEKRKATHPSVLAWRIPWTDSPGGRKELVTTVAQIMNSLLPNSDLNWRK